MARNIDRKALKEDAFQDTMFWMIDWVHQRRKWFIGGGVTLLVVVAAGVGTYQYRQSQLREQTARFYQAERAARQPELSDAEAVQKARDGYEKFIADYPDSHLTPVAWMHVARLAWRQDDAEGARSAYEAVLGHSATTAAQRDLAHVGLAKLAESQGNLDVSAEQYGAVTDAHYEELKALSLGRIASARNQAEEARRYFEEAARAAPGSMLGEWARQNLDYHP